MLLQSQPFPLSVIDGTENGSGLTDFMSLVFLYTPWKQKAGFLMFLEGTAIGKWHEMG